MAIIPFALASISRWNIMNQENINIKEGTAARFSNRADYYARYRPGYPDSIIDVLSAAITILPTTLIADVGSGTGILSELFLRRGSLVFGIEPNVKMRVTAEEHLAHYPNFTSIAGSAEIPRFQI